MNAAPARRPDPIRTFLPWIDDEERDLRIRILRAREVSARRAVAAAIHGRPRALFWTINEIAHEWLLAPAQRLAELADALAWLFAAAAALERLEPPTDGDWID